MAACAATQEAMWLRMLLRVLGVGADEPMVLNEDNQSSILFAKSQGARRRSKQIVMKHVATEFQIADMLTKALAPPTFVNLRVMMLGE